LHVILKKHQTLCGHSSTTKEEGIVREKDKGIIKEERMKCRRSRGSKVTSGEDVIRLDAHKPVYGEWV
jgi:hypothetical protein